MTPNEIARKLMYQDDVRSHYYATCNNYYDNFIHPFFTEFHVLLNKTAMIICETQGFKRESNCYAGVKKTCLKIFKKKNLWDRFESLNINILCNKEKHQICENAKLHPSLIVNWVTLYNQFINEAIALGLPCLRDMYVTKQRMGKNSGPHMTYTSYGANYQGGSYGANYQGGGYNSSNNNGHSGHNANTSTKKPSGPKPGSVCKKDEKISVTANLFTEDGFYYKGIFTKTCYLDLCLNLSIVNPNKYKIKSANAKFVCGKNTLEEELERENKSVNKFRVLGDDFNNVITAKISIKYKIPKLGIKVFEMTVSNKFIKK